MSDSRSILRPGVLAGLLLSVGACGSGAPAPLPSPVGSKPASSGPTAAPSPVRGSADVIKLDCSWGESIESGIRHPVLGVDTDLAGARGTGTRPAGGPTFGGRMLIKSPLTVDRDAEDGTTLQVESPADARLYYTSWSAWSRQPAAKTMITAARRRVTAGRCDRVQGFPGGIVVSGPTCVTIGVLASDGRHGRLRIPLGASCPGA